MVINPVSWKGLVSHFPAWISRNKMKIKTSHPLEWLLLKSTLNVVCFCFLRLCTGFRLAILLPQCSECWDYRWGPPHPTRKNILSSGNKHN
jgi:hypothetical protein